MSTTKVVARTWIAGLVAVSALPAEVAGAAPLEWAVLPARGPRPPPRDPTLMRLTEALSEALGTALAARTTVVSAALADDACPSDTADCPRDVAILVSAQHVVTFWLREDHSAVDVRSYAPRVGLERSVTLPCKWSEGLIACTTDGLAKLVPPPAAPVPSAPAVAPPPKVGPKSTRSKSAATSPPPSPTAPDPVAVAFAAAAPRLARCKKEGWGGLAPAARPAAMAVRFRVAADGVLRDVRLDPSGFLDVPALACMARVVESIELTPGVVDDAVRTQPLPLP